MYIQKFTVFTLASLLIGSSYLQPAAQGTKQTPSQKKAESQPQEELGNETIKIDTELVQLDVTVFDQNNNPIYGLGPADFTVLEDQVKQRIESVSREEIPVSFGIVIDTSGSMRSRIKTISDAAISLIKQKRPEDEGFVVQFKSESEIVQPFTEDESDLESAIGDLYTGGGTALLDAIIYSSGYAQTEGKRRRKVIIVISDGLDKNSENKEREAINAIKFNEVQLYMIGFLDKDEQSSPYVKSPAQKAKELLESLARDSGGRAYFPTELNEIPGIAAQIAKDLRTQYVVSYYPSNEKHDGTYRTVQVDVNPRGNQKIVAHSRVGYYAQGAK